MHWNIETVILVANAMIEAPSLGNYRFLSYQKIEQFGKKIIEILRESNDFGALNLSKVKIHAMLEDFPDFFVEEEHSGLPGIRLCEDKVLSDLIREFRAYLPLNILLAFTDIRARQVLEKEHDPGKTTCKE